MPRVRFNFKPIIVLVISLTVLTIMVFGLRQWQRNRLAYNFRQLGLAAYENHIWQDAAAKLGRYLAVNGDDVEILLKYAEVQLKIRPLKRNNIQQAGATYRSILRINSSDRVAAEKLISLYLQLNVPAEAELIARRYLHTNKGPMIETMLAIALVQQRKFEEAAAQLQSVIEDYPEQIPAYEVMAQLSNCQGEGFAGSAEYWFNESVKNNPSSANALIGRAGFYLKNRQIDAAATDLVRAEKLDLSDLSVRLRLADEFAKVNMFEKARRHLTEIRARYPADPALWQIWASVALRTMSKEEMGNIAEAGLKELTPDAWDFMPTAAELFIRCGQFDRAGDCLTKLKQNEIDLVGAAFLEGLLAEAQKQDHEAVMFWRRAQQLGDKSEKTRLALARAYWRTGDSQSAILQLRTLISEQPALPSAHYHLARLLAQTGSWAEAEEQARLAAQISADNIDAVLLYIRAQIQLAQSNQPDTNEQRWQQIETQLAGLEDSAGGLAEIKLLQFQLAMHRGQHSRAEELLSDLKTEGDKPLEVAIAEIDLLIALNKIDQAISELYILRKKFAQNILPVRYLAALLTEYGNKADCEKVLKEALQSVDEPGAKRDLGILLAEFYHQWQQGEKGLELLTSLAQQMPSDILIKRQLLRNDRVRKDVDGAQQFVDDIRAIEGEQGWQWRYEQARLWLAREDFKDHYAEIIGLLKQNLAANPAEQTSRVCLAAAYEKAGELELATATYREALDRSPQDLRVIVPTAGVMYKARGVPAKGTALAVQLQIAGRYSEAADVYKQILAIAPEALIALNNLAWIMCEEQGKYEQALEFTQTGLRKAPEYVDLIDTRGVIYYRMAEHHKAVRDFNKCIELCPSNSPGSAISRFHLARSQIALGQNRTAADNLQETIELNKRIGGLSSTEVTEAKFLLDELLKKGGNVRGNK